MNKDDLKKFYIGLLGFPVNIFNEDDPNYEHNMRVLKRIGELKKKEGL